MKITKIIAIGALVIFFASCCACRGNRTTTAGKPLTGTTWQVVQMNGANFAANSDSFTLHFTEADKRVSGRGDCNNISGGYEAHANGKLELKGLVSTRAFCPDQTSEDRFLSILNEADSYTIDGNMLMIFNNGEVKMMLEAK